MVLPFKGILYDSVSLVHAQGPAYHGRRMACADFEINHIECLEAYGLLKGKEMCVKYAEDLYECKTGTIRAWRSRMIAIERYKKVAKGELPLTELKPESPPYDAFITGTFSP